MTRPRVLVIGGTNIDFTIKTAHLPAEGETVSDGVFVRAFGGKGANQAVAAARAGGEVALVTCLGSDALARQARASLDADGIDTTHIIEDPDHPSGTALIMLDEQGRNYLAVAPGSNNTLAPAHIEALQSEIAEADMIVLQMEILPGVNERVLGIAACHDRPVVFNYAPTRGVPLRIGEAMSVLVVNENEAAELLGRDTVTERDAAEAAATLLARGPRIAVVTLGAAGLVAVEGERVTRVSGLAVSAVDTTAAGDTFCGCLAAALGEGRPLDAALRFANAAAALATTVMGAQPSIPTREAIEDFLENQGAS